MARWSVRVDPGGGNVTAGLQGRAESLGFYRDDISAMLPTMTHLNDFRSFFGTWYYATGPGSACVVNTC